MSGEQEQEQNQDAFLSLIVSFCLSLSLSLSLVSFLCTDLHLFDCNAVKVAHFSDNLHI